MLDSQEFTNFIKDFCNRHLHESYGSVSRKIVPSLTTVEAFVTGSADTGIFKAYQILEGMGTSLEEFSRELQIWIMEHGGEEDDGQVREAAGADVYHRNIQPEDLSKTIRDEIDMRARNDALDIISRAGTREKLSPVVDQIQGDVDYRQLVVRYLRIYLRG